MNSNTTFLTRWEKDIIQGCLAILYGSAKCIKNIIGPLPADGEHL